MTGALAAFLAIPEAAVLGLIVTAAGRRLCSLVLPDSTGLERSVLGFPAGMALLSIVTTAGLFAQLPPTALRIGILVLLLGAGIWSRSDLVLILSDLRGAVKTSRSLVMVVALAAALGAIGCMAPETGWDTGVYHFAMAKLRAEQGGMIVRLDVPHGFRPASLESLHTVGFLLNGETLASLVNLMLYFGGLALVRLWGLRLAGARGGLCGALAWLTSVTYVLRMDGGDVEVGQAVYLGVLLYALLRLRDGAHARWRLLAGLALGLLVGIKYASLYAVLVTAVVWVGVRLRDRAWRALLMDGLVLGGLGILIACPWYLRNRAMTGTAFFPYEIASAGIVHIEAAPNSGAGAALIKTLGMDGFVLAGVVALLLPAFARDRWTGLVTIGVTAVMLWKGVWDEPGLTNVFRYASPAWLPLLALGGAAVARGVERGGIVKWAALGALTGGLLLGQGVLAARNGRKLPVALGAASRDAYLASRVSTYDALRAAESALPAGKRILLVEERVYYCRAPFLAASDIQGLVKFDGIRDAAEFRRFLEIESIGAIVVDRTPNAKIRRFRDLEARLGPAWPPAGVRAVSVPGDASLYRVE